MAPSFTPTALLLVVGIILLARPAHAFGAGNIASISKIEGQNWRHGDIEDVLLGIAASRALGRKFGKLDVKRVYFGNWLRDYSQAVDVGTVKYVSAKAITLILWVLGFMSFGYGTGEFEVTMERLGCYRPEEHIDNPKDYADNEDARNYDRRLRGPVDERRELTVDHQTGMKNYIASENVGITTSAGLVRELFGRCIELGRRYNRNHNKADLYEALRLLGTGCHCLEDFSAHSNYVELALIEMGERDIFPHVGRNTQIQVQGARNRVFPLITGTFGGVDFLHSVTGEFDDKVTQSEIQELETAMNQAQNNQENKSILQDLLSKVPDGILGDKNEAGKADQLKQDAVAHQMSNTHISPRQPEEWLQYIDTVRQQIYPILQYHDEIMQGITETVEKIPILPDLLEKLSEELNVFVFSLLAPYVLPIIKQVKSELNTGSSAIIESSEAAQHVVFHNDNSTDPTHSMLSKDHFSNVLNEPAGKVAGQVLKWAVPQIMACWDDEHIDVNRTMNRIIHGVLHHPTLREYGDDGASDGRRLMFGVVEQWWREKSDREKNGLRDQLSRQGVETGRNHKPGVVDHGHGSCKPLGMPGLGATMSSGAPGGALSSILSGVTGGGGSSGPQSQFTNQAGKMAAEAVGGGVLGGLVGGLVSGVGGDILGGGLDDGRKSSSQQGYSGDGSHYQTVTQTGHSGNTYGQAQYSRTDNQYGGHTESYKRVEESHGGSGGYQREEHTTSYQSQSTSSYGGGYSQQSEYRQEEYGSHGRRGSKEHKRRDDDDSDDSDGKRKKKKDKYKSDRHHSKKDDDSDDSDKHGRRPQQGRRNDNENVYNSSGYQPERVSEYGSSGRYGGQETYGRRQDESESYGSRREDTSYGSGGYGRRDDDISGYGRQQPQQSYNTGYGQQNEPSSYGGCQQESYGGGFGRQEQTYGGGGYAQQEQSYGGGTYGRQDDNLSYGGAGGHGRQEQSYGGGNYGRQDDNSSYGGAGGYGRQEQSYGGGGGDEYGRRRDIDEDEPGRGYGDGYGGGNEGAYGGSQREDQYGNY